MLGIGIAAGEGVSVGLLVAIFVSNLPEAIGSATEMRASGTTGDIRRLWLAVAVICTVATIVGYAIADAPAVTCGRSIDGFAAGALLVMLIDNRCSGSISPASAASTSGMSFVRASWHRGRHETRPKARYGSLSSSPTSGRPSFCKRREAERSWSSPPTRPLRLARRSTGCEPAPHGARQGPPPGGPLPWATLQDQVVREGFVPRFWGLE